MERRLNQLSKQHEWEHISDEEYISRREEIVAELKGLPTDDPNEQVLKQLAGFLNNVVEAWRVASQEQRNKLARTLFEEVKVEDKQVVTVKPKAELQPFFRLSHECQQKSLAGDPDRVRRRARSF